MFKNSFFNLSALGYLHHISDQNNEMSIILNLINQFDAWNRRSHEVWLKCQVSKNDFRPLMSELGSYLSKKKSVILQFDAEYSGLEYCHIGITQEDPEYIVQLKGVLKHVHDFYIDNVSHVMPNVTKC